jgi:hypothetical protein
MIPRWKAKSCLCPAPIPANPAEFRKVSPVPACPYRFCLEAFRPWFPSGAIPPLPALDEPAAPHFALQNETPVRLFPVKHHHACGHTSSTWIWRSSQHRSSIRLWQQWASECGSCTQDRAISSGISLTWSVHASTKDRTRRSMDCARLSRVCLPRRGAFGAQRHARSLMLATSYDRLNVRHALRFDQTLWSGLPDLALRWL